MLAKSPKEQKIVLKALHGCLFSRETQLKQRTVRKRGPSYMKILNFSKRLKFYECRIQILKNVKGKKVHFFTKHGGLTSVDSQFDLNHLHFPKGSNIGLIILVDS